MSAPPKVYASSNDRGMLAAMKLPLRDFVRFFSFVAVRGPRECWPWKGGTRHGYGSFRLGDRCVPAHRLMLEVTRGPEVVATAKLVRHTCDTPLCVNPLHLLPGDKSDNRLDSIARGRSPRGRRSRTPGLTWRQGENNVQAKLCARQVAEIRARFADGSAFQHELAKQYGVSRALIGQIVQRKRWAHV